MTDGRKNPNDPSEEDWAMSESESNLHKEDLDTEQPPEDVNENVSSLYDPLDTGDLEGWDISAEDAAPIDFEPSADQQQQEHDPLQDTIRTPQNNIEIISPEKPPVQQESWEVKSPPPQDGWQMPQPEFRCSDGKPIQKANEGFSFQAAAAASPPQEVDENLSQIYSPPETVEVFDEDSEEDELSILDDEDEIFDTEDFEEISETESEIEEKPGEVPVKKAKGKTFAVLAIGFLLVSLILLGILGVAYFYYFDKLNAIFGN